MFGDIVKNIDKELSSSLNLQSSNTFTKFFAFIKMANIYVLENQTAV